MVSLLLQKGNYDLNGTLTKQYLVTIAHVLFVVEVNFHGHGDFD